MHLKRKSTMWFTVSLRWISFSFSYFAPKFFKLSRGTSNLTPIQQHECKEWKWTKIIEIEDFCVIKLTECGTRSTSDCNLRELQTSETTLPIKQFIYFSLMFFATRFIPLLENNNAIVPQWHLMLKIVLKEEINYMIQPSTTELIGLNWVTESLSKMKLSP